MNNFLTALAIVVALLVAALVALRFWMAQPHRVFAEIAALPGLSDHERDAIADCLEDARHADDKTWPYDLSAPIVMLLVLLFVKRGANQLPRLFSKWDNNVSLNGDGEVVRRGDRWVNLRDIGWMPEPGERVYTYDDPAYTGDAYYAKGHHPRSFWARWVWLGWRNRASQLSVDLGRDVAARPVCISGDTTITRSKPGHFLLRDGASYHFKSIERVHLLGTSWALTRSYGFKLEHALYRPAGDYGRAAAVAIGWSLKRWKD